MQQIPVLDLFSGIGGFSLGLERTGEFKTVAFCEIEEWPRKLLKQHWPEVPCYEDVRELSGERLRADGVATPRLICGGFPCQDISLAGKGAGITEETRSGLWSEISRLTCEIRPDYLLVENVSALLSRGLGDVLGDLASIGYDAEWHCIPASAIGAPHRRDRIWIVAYPNNAGNGTSGRGVDPQRSEKDEGRQELAQSQPSGRGETMAYPQEQQQRAGLQPDQPEGVGRGRPGDSGRQGAVISDAEGERVQGLRAGGVEEPRTHARPRLSLCSLEGSEAAEWQTEPDVGRVVDGVPGRVDRIKGLGNAIVPQMATLIGNAIIEEERRRG